jgi:hypothetical protein
MIYARRSIVIDAKAVLDVVLGREVSTIDV